MAFLPTNRNLRIAVDLYFKALKEQHELLSLIDEEYSDLQYKSLQVKRKTADLDLAIFELNRFIRQNNLNDSFYQFLDAFRTLSTSRV